MHDEILFPIDRSPAAEQAMPHVFNLAERFDTAVHVLFVVNTTRDSVGIVSGTVLGTLEREDRRVVDGVKVRDGRRGTETHGVVRRDAPRDAVLNYTTEYGVEIIVMATHGRTGVERVLFRSAVERVVQAAPVPVLTVRAAG